VLYTDTLFIYKFQRHSVKVVINNYDVTDAFSMVITGYETVNVIPAIIKI